MHLWISHHFAWISSHTAQQRGVHVLGLLIPLRHRLPHNPTAVHYILFIGWSQMGGRTWTGESLSWLIHSECICGEHTLRNQYILISLWCVFVFIGVGMCHSLHVGVREQFLRVQSLSWHHAAAVIELGCLAGTFIRLAVLLVQARTLLEAQGYSLLL